VRILVIEDDKDVASFIRNGLAQAGCNVVLLGFRREQIVHPLDGFGFVVPTIERRRIIAGSWYGPEAQPLALGTRIHRARQRIQFSQVSRIDASLAGRFDKSRRMQVALEWLQKLELTKFVTHRFPAERAAQAFEALLIPPEGSLHIVLTWP